MKNFLGLFTRQRNSTKEIEFMRLTEKALELNGLQKLKILGRASLSGWRGNPDLKSRFAPPPSVVSKN